MPSEYNLIAVIGPTASGKTSFAAHLAGMVNGEVISADSRQVYRRMDIGTGKDYKDYNIGKQTIPVHLIDIVEPGYKYSIFEYQRDFKKAFDDISVRAKFPVLCGGSGMYINAATLRYRLEEVPKNEQIRKELSHLSLQELTDILSAMKVLHNKTDIDTQEHALRAIEIEKYYRENPSAKNQMPLLNTLYLGILYDRNVERERITERLEQRLSMGMIEEVEALLKSGLPPESLTYYGMEYKFITLYLTGKMDYNSMKSQLNTAIHQFAKRQRTWYRKMEREGCRINWIDAMMPLTEKLKFAAKLIYTS
jgi:tRNA dimethylallyltransferase